jgi:hypothetical protein
VLHDGLCDDVFALGGEAPEHAQVKEQLRRKVRELVVFVPHLGMPMTLCERRQVLPDSFVEAGSNIFDLVGT